MPGASKLLCCSKTRRPGANDSDVLAGVESRHNRLHPTLIETAFNDGQLDVLNGHRIVVDAEHTTALTRCRTQAARPLGKVVGGVQALESLVPAVLTNQVIPLRNDVAQRAGRVTERHATVHTTGRLLLHLPVASLLIDLFPVHQTQRNRAMSRLFALEFHETLRISHWLLPP